MSIGSNIKKLRRERDMTQESLAELLGLTPSAVSQWETDRVLPDVMQIPQLANIFRVSADVILGIDVNTKDARIDEICKKANDLGCRGYKKEAVELCREGLREFPDAYDLMEELANQLFYVNYPDHAVDAYPEQISLYEKILSGSKDDMQKNVAVGELCCLYMRTGREEEAKKLAESIPYYIYTREQCMRSTLRGVDWVEASKSSIYVKFDGMIFDIRNMINGAKNVYADGKPYFSDEETLELYRKIILFMETFYENRDYGFNGALMAEIWYERACIHLKQGDTETAIGELEKCRDYILESDAYEEGLVGSSVVIPKEKQRTSILIRPKKGTEEEAVWVSTPTTKNNAAEYSEKLVNSRFDSIRSDIRFAEIEEVLKINSKQEK